ncbi:MAG: hypothetical protein KC486_16495 [Myxococcales bacterium]|nr:hypothetical protein [Myxococcales bacterium]
MTELGVEAEVTALLGGMNAMGGYQLSLVCTDQGLLVASAGETLRSEVAAGLTSLFDDIVVRAVRDLGVADVDELTLSDAKVGRFVVRPLHTEGSDRRLFLVVQVPRDASWRRNTNIVARKLVKILKPLLEGSEDPSAAVTAAATAKKKRTTKS